MAISGLYKHSNYQNNNIDFLINNEIVEYDMQGAGYNIIKFLKLVDDYTIDILGSMPKKARDIRIGKMQKKDKEFSKRLNEGFEICRKMFFEANNIQDDDILNIRKDAIFTLKRFPNSKLNEFVNFREKHVYSSYLALVDNVQVLYNSKYIDIKGISDEVLVNHEMFILRFLGELFRLLESEVDKKRARKFIKEFADEYRNLDLPFGFYREFNKNSMFKTDTVFNNGYVVYKECIDNFEGINIIYNYNNVIVPAISMVL